MKTLKEVSDIVGMTRRVIQEYEKAGLAETPTTRNKYGYLLYDQAHIDRLWKIRFYREMGYEKRQILEIMKNPDYDRHSAMESRIRAFQKKQQELENLITMAKIADETGITPDNIRQSIPGLESTPYDQLIPMVSASLRAHSTGEKIWENAIGRIPDGKLQCFLHHLDELLDLQEEALSPEDPRVQSAMEKLHGQLYPILSPSVINLSWLSLLYAPGTIGAEKIDQMLWPGSAAFLYKATWIYCKTRKKSPEDLRTLAVLKKIIHLRHQGAEADGREVRLQTEELFHVLDGITLMTRKERLELLNCYGGILEEGVCGQVDAEEKDKADAKFIAEAVRSYCKEASDIKEDVK